ncbi:proteasome beta subunit [Amycolatopsis arida]|uniref:Proteasome subunit beta n=1 Tax=Amycolatopsis arida TaxID=587909 RepID=A0A1I5LHS2_9PSEU|nr:proteasome subunit beta [Amycolatopsis arida]TDX93727.1 proteasome beta subunit [Amycolatopsis arida]SFO96858.1 proteasome beta subunit [Amycolatopsis arida]
MVVGPHGGQHPFTTYMTSLTSSFTELLATHHPDALPWARVPDAKLAGQTPHGTTIVALRFDGGVLMAGDRQITSGTTISYRYAQKVFVADEYSCVGVAGSASLAFEMARLFRLELLHYEKIEGRTLSLQGKANKLSSMVRGNLDMATQGLVVVPIYAGYDQFADVGRIFSYDPIGGVSEEHDGYHSIGSGSTFALGSLKKLHRSTLGERDAITVAMEALYDAAEGDVATMGPDLARDVYPVVHVVTADGDRELPDDEVGPIAREVVQRRMGAPDGPKVDMSREQSS